MWAIYHLIFASQQAYPPNLSQLAINTNIACPAKNEISAEINP